MAFFSLSHFRHLSILSILCSAARYAILVVCVQIYVHFELAGRGGVAFLNTGSILANAGRFLPFWGKLYANLGSLRPANFKFACILKFTGCVGVVLPNAG